MRYDDENDLQGEDDPSTIPPMTVCIGAICEGGKAVVMAADRSIGFGKKFFNPNGVSCKIFPISPTVALAVADKPLGADFISKIKFGEANLPVSDIAERVRIALEGLRRDVVEKGILAKLDKTYDAFLPEFFKPSNDEFLEKIKKEAFGFSLDTRVIVAGIGTDGGRLFKSTGMVTMSASDDEGYIAIGAGEDMAMGNLFARCPAIKNMVIGEAAYYVYEAKKMAERQRSVGDATDMVIIRDSIVTVTPDQMKELDAAYQKLKARSLTKASAQSFTRLLTSSPTSSVDPN